MSIASLAVSAAKYVFNDFSSQPAPRINPWEPPVIADDATIPDMEAMVAELRRESLNQIHLLHECARYYGPDALAGQRRQQAENNVALSKAGLAARTRLSQLRRLASPIGRLLHSGEAANTAEAVGLLISAEQQEKYDALILEWASRVLAQLAGGTALNDYLAELEEQLGGVSLQNLPQVPAPSLHAYCDLAVTGGVMKFPPVDKHAEAAAGFIENLTKLRPHLAERLAEIHEQFKASGDAIATGGGTTPVRKRR